MIKPDELVFLKLVWDSKCGQAYCRGGDITPRDLISEPGFPLNHKRAWFLLGKWADKGIYEYGVCLDLGWLTPEGVAEIPKMLAGDRRTGSGDRLCLPSN